MNSVSMPASAGVIGRIVTTVSSASVNESRRSGGARMRATISRSGVASQRFARCVIHSYVKHTTHTFASESSWCDNIRLMRRLLLPTTLLVLVSAVYGVLAFEWMHSAATLRAPTRVAIWATGAWLVARVIAFALRGVFER